MIRSARPAGAGAPTASASRRSFDFVRSAGFQHGANRVHEFPGDKPVLVRAAAAGKFHLYSWAGGTNAAQKIPEAKFKGANPEALLAYPGAPEGEFQILSDDGTRQMAGEDGKQIKDPARKWFRSFWLRLD